MKALSCDFSSVFMIDMAIRRSVTFDQKRVTSVTSATGCDYKEAMGCDNNLPACAAEHYCEKAPEVR